LKTRIVELFIVLYNYLTLAEYYTKQAQLSTPEKQEQSY